MNVFGDVVRRRAADPAGHPVPEWAVDRPTPAEAPLIVQALTIMRRRKWVILGIIAVSIVAGLIITLLMTPNYTARALIEIQRESRNFTMVEGAENKETGSVDLEFYQTQYGLLRAQSLASRVAAQLRLYDNPQFFEMFGSSKAADWFENGKLKRDAPSRENRIGVAAEILLDHVSVDPQRLSRLVEIGFTSPDPAMSKKVVDAWAENFIGSTLERRFEATAYARRFLERRLTQLRSRIDESERQLVSYAARQGIVNLPAAGESSDGGAAGERPLVVDDLASINRALAQATADRVRAQSRLNSGGGTVEEALQNSAISGLRQRRAELSAEYSKMMVQFERDYPPARALEEQIRQLDRSIAREETRVSQTLRENYEAAVAREGGLRSNVEGLKSGVLDLRRRSIQYNIYQRDVDTSRQLYDALLQRYKEIGVAGGVGVNNISVVDPAELPEKPSSPRLGLNLLIALLAGTVLGAGVAFALEQIDQGLSDPADVEKLLNVPLIGTIPKVVGQEPNEALDDRKSVVAEAYTSLRTSLSFSTDHGIPRVLGVTSTRPSEGKTTTSYALALSIARSGKSVVLVDGDMRSPSIHHIVNMPNRNGLSNFLSGAMAADEVIFPSGTDEFFVLPAGPQPPSAPELLASDRFPQLLAELLARFNHVVVDMPPVMGLADAPLIASRVEGVVFVIEMHQTQKSMVRVALDRLQAANTTLLGAVVTKFDTRRAHYGYGYDYGYGYGYGPREA